MTIRPGLVSVTFRALSPARIIGLARAAGLEGIEWGGDVHVPHGDGEAAARVAADTAAAGLTVSGYGSYYRLAHSADEGLAPAQVVHTAARLGAPTLRVWAGRRASAHADRRYRRAVEEDARRLADLAGAAGVTVVLEYHRNTLTDTRASTADLLDALSDTGVKILWQPQPERRAAENEQDLTAVLPRLSNLHVFAWTPARDRLPLHSRQADWRRYLAVVAATHGDRYASLEFLPDDDPRRLPDEAATLRRLLGKAAAGPTPAQGSF